MNAMLAIFNSLRCGFSYLCSKYQFVGA
jgi:hypothetical protein